MFIIGASMDTLTAVLFLFSFAVNFTWLGCGFGGKIFSVT
jgi:hypothetical protein